MTEILIAALFAASLHFLTGLAGMTSFGHAAWFGLGAYGAALLLKLAAVPMEAALLLGPFAAAFGAPLAGAFYAFEIVIGAYTPAALAPVAVAALAGAFPRRLMSAPPTTPSTACSAAAARWSASR
ncbi:hypothetical protein G6F61_014377 [Rhizopus arrhizus]|nr:hypothetical protein G6F61_014377 [Rhizopus arrhizus]